MSATSDGMRVAYVLMTKRSQNSSINKATWHFTSFFTCIFVMTGREYKKALLQTCNRALHSKSKQSKIIFAEIDYLLNFNVP